MKKIIESQISLFSSTSKVSVPIKICYTDDEVEIQRYTKVYREYSM